MHLHAYLMLKDHNNITSKLDSTCRGAYWTAHWTGNE